MATKGYQSYRGRMPGWKKLLIGILVVILLLAGAFLLFQPKLVVDSSGGHWQGWLNREEQNLSADGEDAGEDEEDDFIIDIQEPEEKALHGRFLSIQDDFSALAEGERPVVTMKAANGAAQSADAEMVREKIVSRDAVAKVSCFADTKKADSDRSMAVMSVSGYAWRDPDGNAWLDPYDEAAADYLIGIVQDCAALGFTEIVLEDVQFPTYGIVNRVTYGEQADTAATRAAAIEAFLQKVKAAAGNEVQISIALPAALVESGVNETAGWDLSAIAQIVDRIYMEAEDQSEADRLRVAVGALREDVSAEKFFVAQVHQIITGGSYVIE